VRLILTQKFDSLTKIRDVSMPVLIVHGGDDRYVPSRFSEELYAAAPEPKRLLLVDGATHNNCMRLGSAQYAAALRQLFGIETVAAPGRVSETVPVRERVSKAAPARERTSAKS
jgi:hypothetical protein